MHTHVYVYISYQQLNTLIWYWEVSGLNMNALWVCETEELECAACVDVRGHETHMKTGGSVSFLCLDRLKELSSALLLVCVTDEMVKPHQLSRYTNSTCHKHEHFDPE